MVALILRVVFFFLVFTFIRSLFRNWKLLKHAKEQMNNFPKENPNTVKRNSNNNEGSIDAEYRVIKD